MEAGAICLLHDDSLYCLLGGCNREIANVGHYLHAQILLLGQRLGARRVDVLTGDSGWKERWGFEKEMLYRLTTSATRPPA